MSKQRYVDTTSQKTDFDKVLDELSSISQEKLSWDILRMTQKHFGDADEDNARKLDAFLGSFIVNAALELYDRGLGEFAHRRLEQAKAILEAKHKLGQEVAEIRSSAEEEAFDVSDLLGLDGGEAQQ
ncbi:MAG: hypothetical protein LBR61_04115 [Synergistaceae bacterium]|jgi:hypothetical protein|nr:hypothetical protein [Synergistaceae bacterium]